MDRLVRVLSVAAIIAGCGAGGHRPSGAESGKWDLSYAEIRGMSDDDVEWGIVERVVAYLGDNDLSAVASLPRGARAVYTTWTLEGEVNNGGFEQYFWNTEGALIEETEADLRLIGAERMAELFARAVAARDDSQALDRLTNEFYELDEPVPELRIRYIRDNPDAF